MKKEGQPHQWSCSHPPLIDTRPTIHVLCYHNLIIACINNIYMYNFYSLSIIVITLR